VLFRCVFPYKLSQFPLEMPVSEEMIRGIYKDLADLERIVYMHGRYGVGDERVPKC
jgi:hypothetical protein